MSATSAYAAYESPQPAESTAHPAATAFDVEKIHGPFKADIAQLAHVVRRLLDSGAGAVTGPLNRRRPEVPPPTCISGGFERVM